MKTLSLILCGLISWGLSAQAAPLCKTALLSPPPLAKVDAALNELARLIIDVDLAKSTGSGNESLLKSTLRIKQSEVMTSLGMTKEALRESLKPRIARLQKLNEHDIGPEVERQTRHDLRRFTDPKFTLTKEFSDMPSGMESIEYLSERNSLIFLKDKSVQLFNLETQQTQILVPEASALSVSGDKKTFQVLRQNSELATYSSLDGSLLNNVSIEHLANQRTILATNESGSKVAVTQLTQTDIYDLATGRKIKNLTTAALHIRFVGDNELYWVPFSGAVSKINLSTNEIATSPATGFPAGFLVTSSLDKIIVAASNSKMFYLDKETLQIVEQKDQFLGHGLTEVAKTPGQFIVFDDRYHESGIYNGGNPTQTLFNFENRYFNTGKRAMTTMSSEDGNTIIVLHFTRDLAKYGVDIWHRTSID